MGETHGETQHPKLGKLVGGVVPGNRHVAHSYLRRDQGGRAALDLDRESWATVLRIVLGNPDKAAAATRAGVGVLAMLACDWKVIDVLADDGLVVEIRDSAPKVARRANA